jgi:hypothetical protein
MGPTLIEHFGADETLDQAKQIRIVPYLAAPRHIIASHFVAVGHMQLRIGDGDTLDVRAGEFILLPRNDVHTFGSDLGIAPMFAREVIQPPDVGSISRIKYGRGCGIRKSGAHWRCSIRVQPKAGRRKRWRWKWACRARCSPSGSRHWSDSRRCST